MAKWSLYTLYERILTDTGFVQKKNPLNYSGGGKISKPKTPKHGLRLETKNETGQNSTGLQKTFFWSFWMKLIPEYL